MSTTLKRFGGGFAAAAAVAALGRRRRALSRGGSVAATGVGGLIVGASGWSWGALLVVFFATASALSALHPKHPRATETVAARGSERDAVQVLANGGLPTLLALRSLRDDPSRVSPAFAGAIAAVTADTWATEGGALSPSPPRLITTGRLVPPGTSGGVTPLGTLAAAAGALTIAAATLGANRDRPSTPRSRLGLGLAVAGAGVAGALADSVLGATLQAAYRCQICGEPTESRRHCDAPTSRVRGYAPITNDVVNAAASLVGALVAATATSRPGWPFLPCHRGLTAALRRHRPDCGTDAA